ncbi:UNVERIFIED_CONTAM: hypothetical protein FKN15_054416 [Acipenser sinensis]
MAEAQIHVAERQQLKDQLAHVQQLAQQLQLANQKLESTNQQFLKTMTEQSSELEQLRTQQRLKVAVQEAEQFRKEKTAWERQIGELQGKCAGLDEEKYEAVSKVRDSIQLAEETTLQKDQVLSMEHDHSMKECSLEARVRELEDSSRNSTNELNRLLMAQQKTTKRWKEEARKLAEAFEVQLNNLKLKVAVQEAEQFRKEKTAWERQIGELQGKCAGLDEEKYEAVSKVRDSIQLAEETTLQKDQVENVRKQCNVQIYRLAEELSALQLVLSMEHDHSMKECSLEARVRELEDSSRNSTNELNRLLMAQQKTTKRWKEEARKLAEAFEVQLNNLK